MITKEIADYIAGRLSLTVGVDVFIGEVPKEDSTGTRTQSGIYLMQNPGQGEDNYLPIIYTDVDIWSFDPMTDTAYNTLDGIRRILSRNSNYDLTNYYIYFSHANGDIMDMGRTFDKLKIYKISMRFIYRDKAVIS